MTVFSAAEIDAFREAGRISALARDWAARQIKPGALLRRVQEGAEEQIRQAGAAPSFPAQTSRNQIAAHFCSAPDDPTAFEEGDLVKLDVGAHVDGYPADTGVTIDLSADGRWSGLIEAATGALDAAVAALKDGVDTGEIGSVVERSIKAAGFRPIANLSGHGLARWSLHAPPSIPNIAVSGGPALQAGSVFAVEPFATVAAGYVREGGKAEVFAEVAGHESPGVPDRPCMTAITAWRSLPFAKRYFPDIPTRLLERWLRDLARAGSIHSYRPLVEVSGGFVAWKEHTIYLAETGPEVLTT
ncbi:MAG: type II methionyl aminopeptidase [Chloroflexi bacterium]|nr:type II methionyl aminopeptidase [Chloroflexota bacterium]